VTGCALVAVSYTYVARYYATKRKPDEKTLWTPSSNHICLAGIVINDLMTDMRSGPYTEVQRTMFIELLLSPT